MSKKMLFKISFQVCINILFLYCKIDCTYADEIGERAALVDPREKHAIDAGAAIVGLGRKTFDFTVGYSASDRSVFGDRRLMELSVGGAFGITPWLDLSLSTSAARISNGNKALSKSSRSDAGFGDTQLGARVALLPGYTVDAEMFVPTGNKYFSRDQWGGSLALSGFHDAFPGFFLWSLGLEQSFEGNNCTALTYRAGFGLSINPKVVTSTEIIGKAAMDGCTFSDNAVLAQRVTISQSQRTNLVGDLQIGLTDTAPDLGMSFGWSYTW